MDGSVLKAVLDLGSNKKSFSYAVGAWLLVARSRMPGARGDDGGCCAARARGTRLPALRAVEEPLQTHVVQRRAEKSAEGAEDGVGSGAGPQNRRGLG